MRLRATVVIDFELSDQEAHEKVGTVDAATAAQSMQAIGEESLNERLKGETSVVHASCTVHPLYG